MQIEFEQVSFAARPLRNEACSERELADGTLRITLGHGRVSTLHRHAVTVIVPLRGRMQVSEDATARTLSIGELLIAESGTCLQVLARAPTLWFALSCSAATWRRLNGAGLRTRAADATPVPGLFSADRELRRSALRLVRAATGTGASVRRAAAAGFANAISVTQKQFEPLIARCPGRTLAQRRSVFMRLQRVRNIMDAHCHLELDVASLARMASYSPCHFIRAFSMVFEQTPHALLVEHRLRRAHDLIARGELAITEVAHAIGFEDRCSFARSFKRRFGITATQLRERSHASERMAA